jgi:hypothetical protein
MKEEFNKDIENLKKETNRNSGNKISSSQIKSAEEIHLADETKWKTESQDFKTQ